MDSQLPPISGNDIDNALRLLAALSNPQETKKALEAVRNERGNAEELYKNASEAQLKADALHRQVNEIMIVTEAKALDNQALAEKLSAQADLLSRNATELAQSRREFEQYSKATTEDFTKREVAVSAREQSVEKRENAIGEKEQEAAKIKAEYEAKLLALRSAVA